MLHLTKKRKKEAFDYVLYFFVITTPLFELPQAYNIYVHKSAGDVSIITWLYFLISNSVWLVYGVHHKLKPVIITYLLYTLVEILIVVGILMYS